MWICKLGLGKSGLPLRIWELKGGDEGVGVRDWWMSGDGSGGLLCNLRGRFYGNVGRLSLLVGLSVWELEVRSG